MRESLHLNERGGLTAASHLAQVVGGRKSYASTISTDLLRPATDSLLDALRALEEAS